MRLNKKTKEDQLQLMKRPTFDLPPIDAIESPAGWEPAKGWNAIRQAKAREKFDPPIPAACKVQFPNGWKHGEIGDPVKSEYEQAGFYVKLAEGGSVVVPHFSGVLLEVHRK